jgi:hypothetical protein
MRSVVLLVLMVLAVPAVAQPLAPLLPLAPLPPQGASQAQPLGPNLPPAPPKHRPEPRPLRPIPYVYRQIDHDRVNQGAVGRTNSARSDLASMRTGWGSPGLGGNAM